MPFVLKTSRMDKWRAIWLTSQLVVLAIVLNGVVVNGQLVNKGDENCETLQTEIHLMKEEYDELGRLQRTCNGDISLNKCEGYCNSQVQPSVITPTGFLKECYCCRETFLRDRLVTLTHCYDPDGVRLHNSETATMDFRIKEPAECRCFKCGDFSR